ncbi:MAG: three-Cys-motif partner protein TcmP [Gammaproteobacteria bacterium]|nr:three-Cys-motif partner protein TcmP [Gammaproteobacteria bacterium]
MTIIEADDGLLGDEVGVWTKEKHECLRLYLEISGPARKKFIGPKKAGATFIDLFSGSGRARVEGTAEWIDGSAPTAWKTSVDGDAPFSKVLIADVDEPRRVACAERLRRLNAPVYELAGPAVEATHAALQQLDPRGLHLIFLDPYNLAELDFEILQALSRLHRPDILIHLSAMDLQRNSERNLAAESSAFEKFAPGWRQHVPAKVPQHELRRNIIEYWRGLVAGSGIWASTEMRLITGSRNQPLYWLLMASKHGLPQKFWKAIMQVGPQRDFGF